MAVDWSVNVHIAGVNSNRPALRYLRARGRTWLAGLLRSAALRGVAAGPRPAPRDDRVALGDEADVGAEADARGHGGRRRERDEGIERAPVFVGELATGGVRRASAHREVGVLGEVERVEAARLYGARQLYDADAAIDDRWVMPQRIGSLATSP